MHAADVSGLPGAVTPLALLHDLAIVDGALAGVEAAAIGLHVPLGATAVVATAAHGGCWRDHPVILGRHNIGAGIECRTEHIVGQAEYGRHLQ